MFESQAVEDELRLEFGQSVSGSRGDDCLTELASVRCNPAYSALSSATDVLLLQGPVGPFFDRLTSWLMARGKNVSRIAFQSGDEHDCRSIRPIKFRGPIDEWSSFLRDIIGERCIDCIVLFGQTRRYHRTAIAKAKLLGISVVVLEEGYFRPGFMTMELDGVNGYSSTLDRFIWDGRSQSIEPALCRWHFQKMAWHAARHYWLMWLFSARYPHYQHHRKASPFYYAAYWLKSWARKLVRRRRDLAEERRLISTGQRYFLCALQHEGDSQITHHSPFKSGADFVAQVIHSFAHHTPEGAILVFRQHPYCRGSGGHEALVWKLAAELGIAARVRYLVEGNTPALAERSLGVVVINSTVGLQALERGAPLAALGEALYKRPLLTHFGALDSFWAAARPSPRGLRAAFLAQIKNLTQMPCNIYATRSEALDWN